jgi:hypothetical protein
MTAGEGLVKDWNGVGGGEGETLLNIPFLRFVSGMFHSSEPGFMWALGIAIGHEAAHQLATSRVSLGGTVQLVIVPLPDIIARHGIRHGGGKKSRSRTGPACLLPTDMVQNYTNLSLHRDRVHAPTLRRILSLTTRWAVSAPCCKEIAPIMAKRVVLSTTVMPEISRFSG